MNQGSHRNRPSVLLGTLLAVCGCLSAAPAHSQQAASQPLNGTVSGFGTSFVFNPPVCPGCVETELGVLTLQDGRYIPAILTVAPPWGSLDASVLVNVLDSEAPHSARATHFGNRVDFVIRQQVLSKANFVLTVAPIGTVFVRAGHGGRAGATIAPQYTWGKNQAVANFTWTGAIGVGAANPRSDYVTQFDYARTIQQRGSSWFVGFQQDDSAGSETMGIEEGLVLPFRNGQVELATQQLSLNTDPAVQVQARVIVNWGKLLGRK